MKHLTFTLLLGGTLLLASCGGWSSNQKEAARKSMGDGFSQGIEKSGATVDPKVKEAWLDCVIEKAAEKMTFDEFTKSVGPELEKLQEECAKEVNLAAAIEVEEVGGY
jgi:hypothetical protein